MQTTFALTALAAVAYALPQATGGSGEVVAPISPTGSAPPTAQTSYPGQFQLTVVNVTTSAAKRDLEKRQACNQAGTLTVSLTNGVLTDSQRRTGYIASNYQFQFDAPPQAGAIYTAGFSVLTNGSLALGPSTIFYSCYTGGFSNLYDRKWAPQCVPVHLDRVACSGSSATGGVSQTSDGQPQATTIRPPVSQITDGQVQKPTNTPIVSQITDGQIQATTIRPVVSQISDGQVQRPSSTPVVSQISDGQIQVTTVRPVVSQISDGQIQATGTVRPTTTSRPVVSQISDGQIQATATASRNATATPIMYTGAAASHSTGSAFSAAAIGLVAMLFL